MDNWNLVEPDNLPIEHKEVFVKDENGMEFVAVREGDMWYFPYGGSGAAIEYWSYVN